LMRSYLSVQLRSKANEGGPARRLLAIARAVAESRSAALGKTPMGLG